MGKKQRGEAPPVVADPRFAHVHRDPRFVRAPKKDVKIKVDERFKRMFEDPEFAGSASTRVDKYGRPLQQSRSEDLRRLYRLDKEEAEQQRRAKRTRDESDEEDEDLVDEEQEEFERDVSDEEPESEDEEQDEDSDAPMPPSFIDRARGEGLEESDTDDDFEDDGALQEEDDFEDRVLDRVDVPEGDATRRLALVNMDWDNLRATHLYVMFTSFCPTGGSILSVKVYPSEFGKERMAYEDRYGPPPEVFQAQKRVEAYEAARAEEERLRELQRGTKLRVNTRVAQEEEEAAIALDASRVRKYQLERLRYYYAVIECNSVDTARALYDQCNGLEYESSGNLIDLRYVPEGMEFDDAPRDVATEMPANYRPTFFTTKALGHSMPELTWDAEDRERVQVTKRKFTKEDLKTLDFEAYLASSDSSDDDEEGTDGHTPVPDVGDLSDPEDAEDLAKLKAAKRNKYRALLEEITAKEEPQEEMEITFTPGLADVATELVKKKKKKNEEADQTVWEQYLARRKEKRKERRRAKLEEAERRKAEEGGLEDELDEEEEAMLRAELGDDFVDAARGDRKDAKKKKQKKEKKDKASTEEDARSKAELELLMLDNADDLLADGQKAKHFNMREIIKAQRVEGKRLKAKDRERLAEASKDDFHINLEDERFSALYTSHLFAVDPSAPQFKKTKAMKAIIEERQRRQRDGEGTTTKEVPKEAPAARHSPAPEEPREPSISSLVESVKRKAAVAARPLPHGVGKRQRR